MLILLIGKNDEKSCIQHNPYFKNFNSLILISSFKKPDLLEVPIISYSKFKKFFLFLKTICKLGLSKKFSSKVFLS